MRGVLQPGMVLILYDNDRAYRQLTTQTTYELQAWLRKHCPKLWIKETYYPIDWNLDSIGDVFIFEDLKVAMLFKLTWGGQ